MQFKDKGKRSPGINVTSLIDVMFILLIFFMVTSSFVEQPGMKLELPATKTQEMARIEKLILYVTRSGALTLGSQPVEQDSLFDTIRSMIPQLTEKTLILKADQSAEHGLIVKIMDTAKQAGLEKIVIGTRVSTPSDQ